MKSMCIDLQLFGTETEEINFNAKGFKDFNIDSNLRFSTIEENQELMEGTL